MAETTVTGQEILFKCFGDAGEILSEMITTVSSQTSLIVTGLSKDPHLTLKYALARIGTSSGIRQITGWNHASQTVTLASGFSVTAAVGNVLDVCGEDGRKRGQLFDAVNEAIRAAWPFWYRETIVNAAASSITLAANTHSYSLPAACAALIAIGVQDTSNDAIDWIKVGDEAADFFAVEGQEGAFTIRFHPRFTRNGSFADEYSGENLCTWYAEREAALDNEADTTQLPLAYFTLASQIYMTRRLRESTPDKVSVDALSAQQLAVMAQTELGKLGLGKAPPNPLVAKAYAALLAPPKKEKGKAAKQEE